MGVGWTELDGSWMRKMTKLDETISSWMVCTRVAYLVHRVVRCGGAHLVS